MLGQEWQNILHWVETELNEPQRTQLLTLCKEFEATQSPKTADKPFFKLETEAKSKRQSKRDIQNKLISENPNADNLQNVLKGF
jgi:hypothetical protein